MRGSARLISRVTQIQISQALYSQMRGAGATPAIDKYSGGISGQAPSITAKLFQFQGI